MERISPYSESSTAINQAGHKYKINTFEKVIIILLVFFYYCDYILYLGSENSRIQIDPKNSTLFLFGPLFLFLLLTKRIRIGLLLKRPIVRWLGVYLAFSIFGFIYGLSSNMGVELVYGSLRTAFFSVLIMFMITGFLDRNRLLFTQKVMIWAILFSVLMNILGFFHILELSVSIGRASGFYLNPNTSGIALCLGMVLTANIVPSKWRTFFVIGVGVGVLLTFSRAALLFYVLYLLYYLFLLQGVPRSTKIISCLAIAILAVVFNQKIMNKMQALGGVNQNVVTRMSLITDPLQNESNITGDSRVKIARLALERFMDKPLIGYGLGADRTITLSSGWIGGTHNQLLAFLVEFGVFGFFILIFYVVRLRNKMQKQYRNDFRNYLFGFLFFCMFSHNLFEEFSMLFVHAFAWMILTVQLSYKTYNIDEKKLPLRNNMMNVSIP